MNFKAKGKSRLNLLISDSLRARMDAIQEKTDATSIAEIIRRSFAIYELLIEEEGKGSKVLIQDAGGALERVRLAP